MNKAPGAAELRATCLAWARGDYYPMTIEDRVERLDPELAGVEEMWWSAITSVVPELDYESLRNLTSGPIASLVRVGGDVWLQRIEEAARRPDDRWATVYCDLLDSSSHESSSSWPAVALAALGVDRAMRTYCRRDSEDMFTFWSWELVHAIGTGEAPDIEVWPFLLELLKVAEVEGNAGLVAAGPIEDFVHANAETAFDEIRREAAINPGLRRALRGIYWPDHHPEGIVDGLRAASSEPQLDGDELRRAAFEQVSQLFASVAELLNQDLEELNATRPPHLLYASTEDAIRTEIGQAGAVAKFAEELGLIDHYRFGELLNSVLQAHPGLLRALQGIQTSPSAATTQLPLTPTAPETI